MIRLKFIFITFFPKKCTEFFYAKNLVLRKKNTLSTQRDVNRWIGVILIFHWSYGLHIVEMYEKLDNTRSYFHWPLTEKREEG